MIAGEGKPHNRIATSCGVAATRPARRALVYALLLVALACGKRGAPLPPEPKGPLPPTQVRARQIGSTVVVGFDVPRARGDKPAQQPVVAELIRVSYPAGIEPQPDPGAFRRRGELVRTFEADPLGSGERVRFEDPILRELPDAGVGSSLRYGVRLRDRRGRASPLVVATDLVPVAVGPAPRNLRGEPTADGIRLAWDAPPAPGDLRYNVYRGSTELPRPERPLNSEPIDGTQYLDTGVTTGERYEYFVRLDLGQRPPYRESQGSESLVVTAEDRFAPAAPGGLVAVQEGQAVRLFWDPSSARDLSGYRLYRRLTQTGEAWRRIGPDPVERPLYLDVDVRVGQRLSYRVTAVDRAEPPNEGPASTEVEIELLTEPLTGSDES
jgi:hypothetical protein